MYSFNKTLTTGFIGFLRLSRKIIFPTVGRNGEFHKKINRLTHTAESYVAMGKGSRHAHSRFTKPDNPVSIEDAKEFERNYSISG